MKVHITDLYGLTDKGLLEKHHRIALRGHELGYGQLGIYAFKVDSDSAQDLSQRLDGTCASIQEGDAVFLQLPTSNGIAYETALFRRIREVADTKIILLFHDRQESGEKPISLVYRELSHRADAVIVPTEEQREALSGDGVENITVMRDITPQYHEDQEWKKSYVELRRGGFYIDKALTDALASLYQGALEKELEAERSREDEIQIAFGLYDRDGSYSVLVGAAMQAVMENTSSYVCFHILHSEELGEENRQRLIKTAERCGQRARLYSIDKKRLSKYEGTTGRYTVATLYRALLPQVLNEIPKVIYLDADTFTHRDIKELYDLDIHAYALAAAPDSNVVEGRLTPYPVKQGQVKRESYFNSGVVFMNLERLRDEGQMLEQVLGYLDENPKASLVDQDALNVVYASQTLLLDGSFNEFTLKHQFGSDKELENAIYHFAGSKLMLYSLSAVDVAYYKTIRRTPWRDEGLGMLYRALYRADERIYYLERVLSAASDTKKKHIYYGSETLAMRSLYKILPPREGDYRISGKADCTRKQLLPARPFEALAQEKEPYIVFVLPEADGGQAREKLKALGLKDLEDYFVIPKMLPPRRGGYA